MALSMVTRQLRKLALQTALVPESRINTTTSLHIEPDTLQTTFETEYPLLRNPRPFILPIVVANRHHRSSTMDGLTMLQIFSGGSVCGLTVERIWRADRRLLDLHLWFGLDVFYLFDGDSARLGWERDLIRRFQNPRQGSVKNVRS